MSSSEFALPSQRAYPIPDKTHAIMAKAMADEAEKKGHITEAQKQEIDRKANAKLKKAGHTVT